MIASNTTITVLWWLKFSNSLLLFALNFATMVSVIHTPTYIFITSLSYIDASPTFIVHFFPSYVCRIKKARKVLISNTTQWFNLCNSKHISS